MNSLKMVLLLLSILLSGCVHEPADHYYLDPHKDLPTIGRVALVELSNDSSFPQTSIDVTEALFRALQKKQVFGLTIVWQNDPTWRSLQLDTRSTLTLEQLSAVRKTLECDALLTGTVTVFEPYPHLVLGLRLKLLDLDDGQLLWALEQIWDTADKTTKERIQKYYSPYILPGSVSLEEKLGTVSPLKFIKFVAYEIAETINPKR